MKPAEVIKQLEQRLADTELVDRDPNSILYTAREDVHQMLAYLRARRNKPRKGDIAVAVRIGEHLRHQVHTNPLYRQNPTAKYLALMAANYVRQLKY